MRARHIALIGAVAVILLANTGCRRWQQRRDERFRASSDPYFQTRQDAPPPIIADPRFGKPNGGPEIILPENANPPPGSIPNGPPSSSEYGRPMEYFPTIPPTNVPMTEEPPLASAKPKPPPVTKLPPDLLDPMTHDGTPKIPPTKTSDPSPSFPVGIEFFSQPKERVSVGQRPDTEGLNWLKENRYKSVLHLRKLGADDSSDREQVELRGLKYISIELSPMTLTRAKVREFSRAIENAENQPIFAYDKDRKLAGIMWYLHFRISESMPDSLARSKAQSCGLKEAGDDEQTAWMVKAQTILAESK